MLTIIALLSFATISLFILGITMKGESEIVRDRIDTLRLQIEQDVQRVVPELAYPFWDRIGKPGLAGMASIFSRFIPSKAINGTATRLERAGHPWRLTPLEFFGLKALSVIVFVGLGVLTAQLLSTTPIIKVLAGIIVASMGLLLPDALLNNTIAGRQRSVRRSLADCMDLLVVCAEAGVGLDGAMSKYVEQSPGALSQELRLVLLDESVGKSRADALKAMADRVDVQELSTFVAAVRQAEQFGSSIAHVLRVQSESLRIARNLRAKELAAKAPIKMLFPLVLCIFPALLAVLLAPSFIEIFKAFAK